VVVKSKKLKMIYRMKPFLTEKLFLYLIIATKIVIFKKYKY